MFNDTKHNYIYKVYLRCVMLLTLLLVVFQGMAQNTNNQAIMNARMLLLCVNNIEWHEYKRPGEISITVVGKVSDEYTALVAASEGQKVAGKPIKVYRKNVNELMPTDIIFVGKNYFDDLEKVNAYCKEHKCLLFTGKGINAKFAAINIVLEGAGGRSYELNTANFNADATPTDSLWILSGSKDDLKRKYTLNMNDLQEKEKKLQELEKSLDEQQKQLLDQKNKNQEAKLKNERIEHQLNQTRQQIEAQQTKAGLLMDDVRRKERQIAQTAIDIDQSLREIEKKQREIDSSNAQLKEMDIELQQKELDIKEQIDRIKVEENTINTQERTRTYLIVFITVVILLLIIIIKSLINSKKTNSALKVKNIELNKQKDEINQQAEQLEEVNKELEKLSIVAGKTQNAILIMDRNGYFEWVNAGFTRIYGYTLQLLRNERDENIVNVSGNKSIRNILFKCVSNKQTIIFESDSVTRSGKVISSQTTLTPILNENKEVRQLVAIYTDISKLKEQEAAIRSQNEELLQQRNTLEEQKNQIEEQNRHIKSSINYAQTIQKTILPEKSQIDKYFDNFILFSPKDIVSGDFYWFTEVDDNGHSYQFIGDFDCTGHGVPGAFMSLIGNRLLNEIVNVKKMYSPRDIMENLNLGVIKALKQDQSTNNDGMDTCLCRIEKIADGSYSVIFCGAKRPLYYLTTGDAEIQQLKGDRKSIGGVRSKRNTAEFTNQELLLKKGDMIYLTSDGIIDQNDKDRHRFGTEKFLALLLSLREVPMNRQSDYIVQSLNDYKQDEEQRDDISVIGIKFK